MAARSDCWAHFNKCKDLKVECKYCKVKIKACGNTTNMRNHLKRKHPLISLVSTDKNKNSEVASSNTLESYFEEYLDDDEDMRDDEDSENRHGREETESNISATSSTLQRSQGNISECFSTIKDFQNGGVKSGKLKNAIFYMLVKDDLPLSTVEKTGFSYLMKTAVPLYKIPSRSTITHMVDEKFDILSKRVKNFLKEASHISFTADVWTDTLNTTSYIGITGHFIDRKLRKIRSVVLGVNELSEAHDANYLGCAFTDACTEWSIPFEKIVCVTTDNAANISKAVADIFGQEKHLRCLAHTINLIANKPFDKKEGVEELKGLLGSVKQIVTYFKHCVNASDDLKKSQKNVESPLKLIQSVCTRWNSTYYQLERFLKLSSHVAQILLKYPKAPTMISAAQIEIIEDLVQVFQPFEAITKELSGQDYVTIGLVIPIINCLRKKFESIYPLTPAGISCKSMLLESIESKFGSIEKHDILAKGTLLDPRFKKLHFNNFIICSKHVQKLTEMLSTQHNNRSQEAEVSIVDRHSNSLWDFHTQLAKENLSRTSIEFADHNNIELKSYLAKPVAPMDTNVIKYWCNENIELQNLALTYQTIMATSVPCERLFSLAGNVLTEKRNRLTKLKEILFLKSLDFEDWILN